MLSDEKICNTVTGKDHFSPNDTGGQYAIVEYGRSLRFIPQDLARNRTGLETLSRAVVFSAWARGLKGVLLDLSKTTEADRNLLKILLQALNRSHPTVKSLKVAVLITEENALLLQSRDNSASHRFFTEESLAGEWLMLPGDDACRAQA